MIEIGQVEVALPYPSITIHPISDVHIGADRHKKKAFKAKLKLIEEAGPSHRILCGGDLLNFANSESKSFEHGAAVPNDEALQMVELLKPVASQIDAMLDGNHEDRSFRHAGLRITQWMAAVLGRPQQYQSRPYTLRYSFQPRKSEAGLYRGQAKIFVHHGRGGGRKAGGALNSIKDLTQLVPDANLYLMGHVHQQITHPDEVFIGWPLRRLIRHYMVTGHYLGLEDYALRGGYGGTPAGSPVVTFSVDPSTYEVQTEMVIGTRSKAA